MNQLTNFEKMSLEQVKELEAQLQQRKLELIGRDVERIDHEHKETKFIVKAHEEKIEQNTKDTQHLKDNMVLHSKQSQLIGNMGKNKIIECLGGKDSNAYKTFYAKLRSNFWIYFKNVFGLVEIEGKGSYKDLKIKDLERAKEWIKDYKPKKEFQDIIDELNKEQPEQIEIDI